jgi:hypothetical protein
MASIIDNPPGGNHLPFGVQVSFCGIFVPKNARLAALCAGCLPRSLK